MSYFKAIPVVIPTYTKKFLGQEIYSSQVYILFSNEKDYDATITGMEFFTNNLISNLEFMVYTAYKSVKKFILKLNFFKLF